MKSKYIQNQKLQSLKLNIKQKLSKIPSQEIHPEELHH